MKQKIILCICPPWGTYSPSLPLANIASYLSKEGIYTEILDVNIEFYSSCTEEEKKYWSMLEDDRGRNIYLWTSKEDFDRNVKSSLTNIIKRSIQNFDKKLPIVMIFSVHQENILSTSLFIDLVKKELPDTKIIIGGPIAQYPNERKRFTSKADYIIVKSGTKNLKKLLINMKKEKNNAIPNVIDTKNPSNTSTQEYEEEINHQISFEGFNLDSYTEDVDTITLPLIFSYGCKNKCTFCNDRNIMSDYKTRDPEVVYNEISSYVKNHNVRNFVFNDLAINNDCKKLEELMDKLIDNKVNISWQSNAIPNKTLNIEMLKKMKRSGCHTLLLGIESGSDKILQKMRKGTKVSIVEELLRNMHKVGINAWVNLIVGHPGESEEDFQKTLKFVKRNKKHISRFCSVNTCNVVQHSELYNKRKEYGIRLSNSESMEVSWEDGESTDRIRKERLRQLIQLIHRLGFDIMQDNLKAFETSNQEELEYNENPIKMFIKCYKEHGTSYTAKQTLSYIRKIIT